MPGISFSKLVPSGNPTIILSEPESVPSDGSYGGLPDLAARLMHPMHVQAEQVGALFANGREIPHLQMMGGEFCVNATRAAAFLLARQGRLEQLPHYPGAVQGMPPVWAGQVTVSGMHGRVRVLVSPDAKALHRAIEHQADCKPIAGSLSSVAASSLAGEYSLYCGACIPCDVRNTSCAPLQEGVCLVRLPGISHLLLDVAVHPLPNLRSDAWHEATARWRTDCGLADAPASGVIWYERTQGGYRIWPAVEVRATGSEHLETACGSASLALALLDRISGTKTSAPAVPLDITQPSEERLQVTLCDSAAIAAGHAAALPESAWVSGLVRLVAEGTAYCEE